MLTQQRRRVVVELTYEGPAEWVALTLKKSLVTPDRAWKTSDAVGGTITARPISDETHEVEV